MSDCLVYKVQVIVDIKYCCRLIKNIVFMTIFCNFDPLLLQTLILYQ